MISKLSTPMAASIDRSTRDFAAQYNGGLSQLWNDVLSTLQTGAIGITSDAADVDSLALGGGAFTQDADNTTGLSLAMLGGRVFNGLTNVVIAAGSAALSPSATNYVGVNAAGIYSSSTVGFAAGVLPLYVVQTGVNNIVAVSSAKAFLALPGLITGAQLSTPGATKSEQLQLGQVTATTVWTATAPSTGKLQAAVFSDTAAVAQSDTDYWSFSILNKGAAGTGTQSLLAATAANTTKATGGSVIGAYTARPLVLTTLTSGTELNVTLNDTLLVAATATGSPVALASASLRLAFGFTG